MPVEVMVDAVADAVDFVVDKVGTHPSFLTHCPVLPGGIGQLVPPERVALARQYIQQSDALLQDVLAPMRAAVRRDAASGLRAHPIWKEH